MNDGTTLMIDGHMDRYLGALIQLSSTVLLGRNGFYKKGGLLLLGFLEAGMHRVCMDGLEGWPFTFKTFRWRFIYFFSIALGIWVGIGQYRQRCFFMMPSLLCHFAVLKF